MPSSARKSSIGGGIRRSKAHVPYRGDNPEVGKKTGIAVEHVDRNSDGFEHFEDIIRQADGRTPPRPKGRRSSAADYDDYEDEDEDGEMSMQLDSPVAHLINMPPPTTPTPKNRRSLSRPVARTNDRGFDDIPNPRDFSSTHRSNHTATSGPSRLSKSFRPQSPEEEPGNDTGADYDGGMDYSQYNDDTDHATSYYDQSTSNVNASFSRIEEEDEEEEQEEPTPRPVKSNLKGKQRAAPPSRRDEEEDVEDEIAQGLEDVEMHPSSDTEQEPMRSPPKKLKPAKPSPKKKQPPKRPASLSQKENREYRDGVRRSSRVKIAPLEWWRGERCVYGRPNNANRVLVASVKEIVRLPKEEIIPLAAKRRHGSSRARSTSRAPRNEEIPPALPVINPEEGWDAETQSKCTVLHYTTREEVERRIAWTAAMVEPKVAADNQWSFHKIFGDDDFIAAGQIIIPPGGMKPSKPSKDNTYAFYVVEGAVNFKIHDTSMIVCQGGQFLVPRGNNYFIENICQRDVRLFFTQARKVEFDPEELASKKKMALDAEARRRKSVARTPSVGAHKTPPRPLSTSANPSSGV